MAFFQDNLDKPAPFKLLKSILDYNEVRYLYVFIKAIYIIRLDPMCLADRISLGFVAVWIVKIW